MPGRGHRHCADAHRGTVNSISGSAVHIRAGIIAARIPEPFFRDDTDMFSVGDAE